MPRARSLWLLETASSEIAEVIDRNGDVVLDCPREQDDLAPVGLRDADCSDAEPNIFVGGIIRAVTAKIHTCVMYEAIANGGVELKDGKAVTFAERTPRSRTDLTMRGTKMGFSWIALNRAATKLGQMAFDSASYQNEHGNTQDVGVYITKGLSLLSKQSISVGLDKWILASNVGDIRGGFVQMSEIGADESFHQLGKAQDHLQIIPYDLLTSDRRIHV